jgi:hypothetical protein
MKITEQIDGLAEKMAKASVDPKDRLYSIIKSLGPEGLKAKMAELSDSEKVVLKATLEEMKLAKAISFDKEAEGAKFVQGKVTDTIIQEDKADDDADEKLVKPAAAKMDHQGTPTDGWSGQVIKAEEPKTEEGNMEKSELEIIESNLDLFIEKAMAKCSDDKVVMKKLKEKGMNEGKVQGALDKFKAKKEIEKAFPPKEKEEASEDKEKNPKKKPDEEKKENPFKKSVSWEDESRLLKANTQGRNFNFNIEQFIADTLSNEPKETITKSESSKEDVNDLIEKSLDQNWTQVNTGRSIESHKTNGSLTKSFADEDLAAILGLTEEEAKAILG